MNTFNKDFQGKTRKKTIEDDIKEARNKFKLIQKTKSKSKDLFHHKNSALSNNIPHNKINSNYLHEIYMAIRDESINYDKTGTHFMISEIKNELEDLSFYYLDNDKYHEIAKLVESKKSERDDQIDIMMNDISEILTEKGIPFRIFGRSKHLYSINKKMITKNKRFDEILDLLAIRIVTKTVTNCYEIYVIINPTFRWKKIIFKSLPFLSVLCNNIVTVPKTL